MVRKENVQSNGNSLLKTATSKRVGPGRFASLIARGTAKPPVKKVKIPSSDASRVSELTASVVGDAHPAFIKEVKMDDIDMESSVFGMTVTSGDSYSFAKAIGNSKATTPQPTGYKLPPIRDSKNTVKKSMDISLGLSIKAPSPMSLDRVQVQMGQERTAPESEEYRQEQEEKRKIEEKERLSKEYSQAKRDAAEKLKEVLHTEMGEGFEAQLENDDAAPDIESPSKKKSLVKKMWGKLKPKKPMTSDRARAMAREAMDKSKGKNNGGKPPLVPAGLVPGVLPFQEITVQGDGSISDLDSSQKKAFPVQEIMMKDEGDSRDDTSVSTLGTAHILERMGPGALNKARYGKEVRDPTPTGEMDEVDEMGREEMFLPQSMKKSAFAGLYALIDQIDSGTGTEDAGAVTNDALGGGCAQDCQNAKMEHPRNCGFALAALCMNPLDSQHGGDSEKDWLNANEVTESERQQLQEFPFHQKSEHSQSSGDKFAAAALDTAIAHVEKGMGIHQATENRDDNTMEDSSFSGIDLNRTLSPIEEDDALSPISKGRPKNPRSAKPKKNNGDSEEIIDLTKHASPIMSPTTQDGIKGEKDARREPFSFDNFMDIAASKLTWKKDTDRYAIEEDETPRNVIDGHEVEADSVDDDSIPVVKGVKINKSENQSTPQASGGHKSSNGFSSRGKRETQPPPSTNDVANQLSPQSSFEVYEHPEGDIVMWSENPTMSKKAPGTKTNPPTKKGFPGHFSDGLFDLLSMDESVSRGRKKVPFLSEQPADIVSTDEGEDEAVHDTNMFDFICESDGAGGKKSTEDKKLSDDEGIGHETMDPNLGVMCGAVPLYFMYTMQDKKSNVSTKDAKKPKERKSEEAEDDDSGKSREESQKKKDTEESRRKKDKGVINVVDDTPSMKAMDESTQKSNSEDQPNGFLPMASPKKDGDSLETDDGSDEVMEIPQMQNNMSQPEPDTKVLLDGDDAYWDTLSTIASTKDRSSDSAKITNLVTSAEPGPIPVEITMKSKTPEIDSAGENSTTAEMRKAIGELTSLIEDEENYTEAEEELAAVESVGQKPATTVGSSSNGDYKQGPTSYNSRGQSEYTPPSPAANTGKDEESCDNSGLLLAITRSEGETYEDAPSPRKEAHSSWNQSKQSWRGADAAGVKGVHQAVFHRQQTHYVKTTPESNHTGKEGYQKTSNPLYSDNRNSPKRDPEGVFSGGPGPFTGIMSGNNNAFANPWKNSNRSVSWGVEEIYEPEETPLSPTSTFHEESSDGDRAIMSAIAEAAATEATLRQENTHQPRSPTSNSSQSQSNDTRLSDEEEQELISRTLELSKQLLATMTSQDLEESDNAIVKSLLSFGTNDAQLELSAMNAELSAMDAGNSTPRAPLTPDFSSTTNGTAAAQEKSPIPTTIRSLGPAPVQNEIFNEALFHVLDQPNAAASPQEESNTTSMMGGAISESQPSASTASQLQPSEESSGNPLSSTEPMLEAPSIEPTASGQTEDSPIDVESMFNKYDSLANHLIGANAELKTMAHQATPPRSADPTDENTATIATTGGGVASPKAGNRIEELRAQRAEAMAKINARRQQQHQQQPGGGERQFGNRVQVVGHNNSNNNNNTKDHLSRYTTRPSPMPDLVRPRVAERPIQLQHVLEDTTTTNHQYHDDRLEISSTSSDTNKSTPSMKARELRKQLDQALQATRNIRESQEQLGSELQNFKDRFHQKSDELEDQAIRAFGAARL